MKVRVKWIEGDQFLGVAAGGHAVIMEASASESSIGPSPLEMLLLGMGACASSDVVSILQKMRQNVDDVTVEMEAERADSIPRIFIKIHAVFNKGCYIFNISHGFRIFSITKHYEFS